MTNLNNNSPLPISQPPIPDLIDTHCHIHEADYPLDKEQVLQRAAETGVEKLICVGTDEVTSREAVEFVQNRDNCWASIGLHPHDAIHGVKGVEQIASLLASGAAQNHRSPAKPQQFTNSELLARETRAFAVEGGSGNTSTAHSVLRETQNAPEAHDLALPARKIVAIGECGLDYFYEHSPRQQQKEMLHAQIQLALEHDLPMIFHVRDAFHDFWPIFDQYSSGGQRIRGVVHSFTDTKENMEMAIERGLYIGVNGIATFTKVDSQKEVYATIPLENLVLETDAPFLTPTPKRGTVNEPAFVALVARHLADLRQVPLEELASATTLNANTLFSI